MKVNNYCLVAALLGATAVWGQEPDAPRGPPSAQVGVEVLTRGPVHEAFVGTVTFNPEPGIVVPKAPPEAIEELPPEQRPEGDNVAWIPGYWAWDDERSDFLWVSGIWRNLPPGRQWVPGYWGKSGRSSQWISGYWADGTASEVVYLPEPPASVEVGPNIAASSPDQNWMPGCWLWHQNRYAWRPGYWSAGQQNWVWVPAYYAWTPRGYVFVDGYYDYSVANRGILFAPVYFNSRIYTQRRFSYSPMTVLNTGIFASQLFLRPTHQHYYFGDYYAASYSNAGYYPWYSYNSSRYGYDPIYAQERWQHRQDHEWERRVQADFQHRRDHEDARPPRTWAAQNALVASQGSAIQKSLLIASSLAQLSKSQDSSLRLQPVAQEERQKFSQHGQAVQKFRQERQNLESKVAVSATANPSKPSEPARVKFSKSPLVARTTDQLGQNQAPPKRHEVLKPDLQVEPKPRVRAKSTTGTNDDAKPPKVTPDQPKGKSDLPKVTPDQPKGKSDLPKVTPDQPKDKSDLPKVTPDRPKDKSDLPKRKSDLPEGTPEQPKVTPDQPKDKSDLPKVTPDRPKGKSDLPKGTPDRPKGKSDLPKRKSDLPEGTPEQPKVTPDQPKGKSDLPKVTPDQPKGKSDRPKGKSDQPKGKSDLPKGKSDLPKGTPDQPKGTPEADRSGANRPSGGPLGTDRSGKTPRAGKDPFNPIIPPRAERPELKPPQPNLPPTVDPPATSQGNPPASPPSSAPNPE